VTTHKDIPDEIVKRARDYDRDHWREDRDGERGGSWGSVPADQVRRLIWGAYGGISPVAEPEAREALNAEIREGLEAATRGETADLGSFAQYSGEEDEPHSA
jgi:hypothetical protein